jgi:hypothetical protein
VPKDRGKNPSALFIIRVKNGIILGILLKKA